jgi:hypothetical protein
MIISLVFMIKPTFLQYGLFFGVKVKLVSAGSPMKQDSEAKIRMKCPNFAIDGKGVNHKEYELLLVEGNSMNRFHIGDGQVVFVERCDSSTFAEGESPILVLTVDEGERGIKFKLRKFRAFYDFQEDFAVWLNAHSEFDVTKLKEKWEDKSDKIKDWREMNSRLLVSETTREGKLAYSFHLENRIYGRVKYAVPRDNVEILKKIKN